jgi:hypothetical protein
MALVFVELLATDTDEIYLFEGELTPCVVRGSSRGLWGWNGP